MTYKEAIAIVRDHPPEMASEMIFDADGTIDKLSAERDRLREALKECEVEIDS